MSQTIPSKIFRGSWDEVISHGDEVVPGSVVEVRVYEPESNDDGGDFGGKNLAEVIAEMGTVSFAPTDLARNAEEYLARTGFGKIDNAR